jgi:hypothetical protein
MTDHKASYWFATVSGGLALVAVAWLLVSLDPGTSGGNVQVGASDRRVSHPLPRHHRVPNQMPRCIDATPARVPGCLASPVAPSAPTTPPVRRVQRSTRPGTVGVTPPATQVPALSAPASPQPSTTQPSATPSPAPSSPAQARQPLPHNGPVPGGNTSPPHTGPRP